MLAFCPVLVVASSVEVLEIDKAWEDSPRTQNHIFFSIGNWTRKTLVYAHLPIEDVTHNLPRSLSSPTPLPPP